MTPEPLAHTLNPRILARLSAYGTMTNGVGHPTQPRPRMRGYRPSRLRLLSGILDSSTEVF